MYPPRTGFEWSPQHVLTVPDGRKTARRLEAEAVFRKLPRAVLRRNSAFRRPARI